MAGHRRRKTPKDDSVRNEAIRRAAIMAATGHTCRQIAGKIGINACTLSDWRKSSEFKRVVMEIHQDAKEAASSRLIKLSLDALTTVQSIMLDPDSPTRERLTAAKMVLELVKPEADISPIDVSELNDAELEKLANA